MEVQRDFKELLASLNGHGVKYVIVGGYALAFHGAPRYTGDLDIFAKPDKANAKRILAALHEFGLTNLDLSAKDFKKPDMVLQLGVSPVRVDIITSLTGVSWQQVNSKRIKGKYGGVSVSFISRKHLILNKKATGRKRDLADIEALGE
ncbi:MAG: nucleotidyltransferase [Sedimentisphaerales bacterium]|nr:nucleotidyltransferase [Sedimentisphaerales bacterium]